MAGEDTARSHGRRHRVLLFPLPYQGHINPMFRLAGVLHARGFAITIFHTTFNSPDPAHHPEYDFVAVHSDMSMDSLVTLDDAAAHILAVNTSCEAEFRERLAAVLEDAEDDVACLVADVHMLSVLEVAQQLRVPTLALRTSSAAWYACYLAYPELCQKGYVPVRDQLQLDAPVSELAPYRVRDLPSSKGSHDMLCKLLSRTVTAAESSTGLIINAFDGLESTELAKLRRDLAVPVFDIGPLHKFSPAVESSLLRQDRSCLEWLDTQATESVLYVSFGSVASMDPNDLVETAWGIANSGQPFIWVIRPGLVRGVQQVNLPDGFEDKTRSRGMVVHWAPQEEVLSHRAIGGFWTHNGWNSTLESICEGVPMLCWPYFADQMANARYVEHVWRIGFELERELERTEIAKAIRRLMQGKDGAEMRGRARELKKKAMECVSTSGSSYLAIDKLVDHILSL